MLEKCDLTINYIHQKDVDKKFFAVNAFSEIELTLSFKYLRHRSQIWFLENIRLILFLHVFHL